MSNPRSKYTDFRGFDSSISFYTRVVDFQGLSLARLRRLFLDTGVCEINTPFAQVLALPSNSRNCSTAPELVFSKLILSRPFFWGGVFFSQTPVFLEKCLIRRGPEELTFYKKKLEKKKKAWARSGAFAGEPLLWSLAGSLAGRKAQGGTFPPADSLRYGRRLAVTVVAVAVSCLEGTKGVPRSGGLE